jgi:1,4-dihydroxy-2-naphthoate octaprenyltransferase
MYNIMNEKMINRAFVIGIIVLFCLAFVQLSITGFPFAGVSCLCCAVAVLFVAKSEEKRVK